MSGRLLLTFAFALLVFPFFASASTCPNLKHNLSFGSRGQDVIELQNFLIAQHDLATGNNTGYFGRLTESAVKKFQRRSNIVSSGTPSTTGYGAVGPNTRMRIKTACGASSTTSPTALCINPPSPNVSCDGQWKKVFNQNQCHVGWTCVVTQSVVPEINKAPFIASITGPTFLKPNETGTWKITARDPENDALVYSVIWGDEGRYVSQLLNIAQEGTPYRSATTISHTYKNIGFYTIVVFAKDTGGNIVKATLSVSVREPVVSQATPSIKIGGRVKATVNIKVRAIPFILGNIRGQQVQGARGIVIGGPTTVRGRTWWKINWDSGPDGWSVQDYLEATVTMNTTVTTANIDAALQSASQALEKANTALLNANNSVLVANNLQILPGTLPAVVPALNSAIATAKRSADSAVKYGQKAVDLAGRAHVEAMLAAQLTHQGQTDAASIAVKRASNLARQSLPFSSVVEKFVHVVDLIRRLLSAAILTLDGV